MTQLLVSDLLRSSLAIAFVIVGTAAFANAAPSKTGQSRKLNILILLADDMGWGDLGCQGHPFAKTPAIDRLAATGCRLEQFYVTAPVCSPSRAGLLTGRIQNRFGMEYLIRDTGPHIFHHVPLEEPSLPRLLKAAGYLTAHIGKWHLSFVGRDGEPTMHDYGYDHSLVLAATRNESYKGSRWQNDGKRTQTPDRWSADVYVDEAIRFIEEAKGRPFFINLWSFAPHQEVDCAPRFRELYKDRTESEQYFYGTISQMDEQYGRLLDYLARKGLSDNTIVFFTSDNGPEPHLIPWSNRARGSTGGLRGGKHHLYDGGIREPGIVRWPGVTKPGTVSREVCWTPDIVATLSAALDLETPNAFSLDGIDIRPALRGNALARTQPLYWQFPFGVNLRDGSYATAPGLAIRDGVWKLHCDLKFEKIELYNMDIDANEKWNMQGVYPEIAVRLLGQIKKIYAEVNGPYSRTAHFINPQMRDPAGAKTSGKREP